MKKKLQQKRRVLKHTGWVPVGLIQENIKGDYTAKVTVEIHSYICPLCGKRKHYTTVNGQIISGCGGTFVADLEHCGSRECDKKADRILGRVK